VSGLFTNPSPFRYLFGNPIPFIPFMQGMPLPILGEGEIVFKKRGFAPLKLPIFNKPEQGEEEDYL